MLETKQRVKMNEKDAADKDIGGCIACGWTILDLPPDVEKAHCPNCGEYHCYGHNKLLMTGCLVVEVPKPKGKAKAKAKVDTSPLPLVPMGGEDTSTTGVGVTQAVIDAAWENYSRRLEELFGEGKDADPEEVAALDRDMDDLVKAETQYRWERAVDEMDTCDEMQESPFSESQYNGY